MRSIKNSGFVILLFLFLVCGKTIWAGEIPISVIQLYENFESDCELSGINVIVEDTGNHAICVKDTITPIVYTPPENAIIEGKFKIVSAMGEQNYFEIIPQSNPRGEDYFGADRYNIFGIDINRGFIRIGKRIGPDVEINDLWNNFRVFIIGNKAFFEVNETLMCFEQTRSTPGLRFRAEGCEVLIDDLKISKVNTGGATISALKAVKSEHVVSPYEPYDFLSGAGLMLSYSSGTRINPVKTEDITYTVEGEYRELSRGYGYFYSNAVVKFTFQEFSCSINIISDDLGKSKAEHLSQNVYKRRQGLAYLAYDTFNNTGFMKSTVGYSRLMELMSEAYLYPVSENHEEIFRFLLEMAENTNFETRGSVGAEDFIVIDLMLLRMNDRLNISDELKERFDSFIYTLDFSDPEEELSENHRITYYAIAVAALEYYENQIFFNGLNTSENKKLYKEYILDWVDFRLQYGMGEYSSSNYYTIDFAALETIYTYTTDVELKRRVYEMLMYIYTDAALNSNNSVMGGAQSRVYVNSLKSCEITALDIFFDDYIKPDKSYTLQMLPLCFSQFVPQKSLIEFKADSDRKYTYIQKRRVYTIPDDPKLTGVITKYSYITPKYIIGSLVQSDNLPDYSYKQNDKYYVNTGTFNIPTRILPDFQALGFSVNINGNSLLNIIDSHPGTKYNVTSGAHSYFSGDHGCHCARYGQHEHTVIGMRHISDSSLPQFSHFYFNRDEFDEVVENNGWIIARYADVYVAILPVSGCDMKNVSAYEWGSDEELFSKTPLSQLEIKINSPDSAFVAEVYSSDETGSFDEFCEKIYNTKIEVTQNTVIYNNIAGDELQLNYDTEEFYINGKKKIYIGGYSDNCTEYIRSNWGNSIIKYQTFSTPNDNYVNIYKSGKDRFNIIPLSQNGRLFIAEYDEDGFLQDVKEYFGGEVYEVRAKQVKAILLESAETMKPLTAGTY